MEYILTNEVDNMNKSWKNIGTIVLDVQQGAMDRSVRSSGLGQSERSLEFDLPVGDNRWGNVVIVNISQPVDIIFHFIFYLW